VIVELALGNLVGGLNDGICDLGIEAETDVGLSSCLLKEAECADHRERHALALTADLEVLKTTLSLSAPVFVPWDLDGAESVLLLARLARGQEESQWVLLHGACLSRDSEGLL
jgi:hypothetical protein